MLVSLFGLKLNLLTYGINEFGIWLLLLSIWGAGAVLDLGFGISLIRFIACNKDDEKETQTIIATGFIVFLILGSILVAGGIGVAELFYFTNAKLIPPEALGKVHIVHYLLAGNFFFQYMTGYFKAVFEGHEDFIISTTISMIFSGVLFGFIVIVYALHLSLPFLGAGYCLTAVMQLTTFYLIFRRKYPSLAIRYRSSRLSMFRAIFRFSAGVQGTFLLGALMDPVLKYILGVSGRTGLISMYEIARRFAIAISGLFSSAFRNLLPKASALRDKAAAKEFLYSEGVRLAGLGISYSGIMYGAVSFVCTLIIAYFYGLPEGITIFFLCALAESVNNVGYFSYVVIIGTGKSALLMLMQAMNLLLVPLFVIAGFRIFGNSLGLAGYYFSVILGNIAMLMSLRYLFGIEIRTFIGKIKLTKLIALHAMLFLVIALLSAGTVHWLWIQGMLTIACSVIFFDEAKFWMKNVQMIILRRNVALL